MPLKHFPELQLSISVLILRQLITKYWIDFLNEYGAGPVIVAKNRKCIESTVFLLGGSCGFAGQTLAKCLFLAQILQFISFAGHLIRGCREFP